MDKERLLISDGGFSEKELDLAVDKTGANDQAKPGIIFDPQKKNKKPKNDLLTESK